MPSDQCNLTIAKVMRFFSLFNIALAQEVLFGIPIMHSLWAYQCIFHSSLLTGKSVNSVVAHDGFLFITENFILTTLIPQLLFKYFVGNRLGNGYFTFQTIIDKL